MVLNIATSITAIVSLLLLSPTHVTATQGDIFLASSPRVVQTAEAYPSKDSPDRLNASALSIVNKAEDDRLLLAVDISTRHQALTGFGGAITDSVAHNFFLLKNKSLQDEVIESLFGPTGQQYNLMRLTIGSTDFSTRVYNYNEPDGKPLPQPDFAQTNFSIAPDEAQVLPMILLAQARAMHAPNGQVSEPGDGGPSGLRFLSTSWSPPGWMKQAYLANKGHMRNSAKPGMKQGDPRIFKSYAKYLSKYLSAYKAAGVNVTMMTIQNEPDSADHMFPVAYPCNNFNGTGEGSFLKDYLGPQVRKDHPDVRIYVHDGQKFHDVPILDRVDDIIAAAGGDFTYIDGVAFHWYGNNLDNYQYLRALHEKYPDLPLLATEATLKDPRTQVVTTTPWKEAQKYAVDIIGDLNEGTEGWIEWNVLLDTSGGPTCIGGTSSTGCTPEVGHCDAPILIDLKKQTLEYRDSFWIMAHFSRYLPRGSVRVDVTNTTGPTDLKFTAFVTPALHDNNLVVVVLNTADDTSTPYQLQIAQGQFVIVPPIPGHAIQTVIVPFASIDLTASSEEKGALDTAAAVPATFASFRKDFYLDEKTYPEGFTPAPTTGGRVHVIGTAAQGAGAGYLPPYNVSIGGVKASTDPSQEGASFEDNFDWLHVDYNNKTGQVAVAFHTHSDALIGAANHVLVTDGSGRTVLDATVTLPASGKDSAFGKSGLGLAITYVTTRNNFQDYIVHIHNYGTTTASISAVVADGVIATGIAPLSVAAGEHSVLTIPCPAGTTLADVWTIGLVASDGGATVGYGGRVVREVMPIADWPKSADCPFPTANASNFATLKQDLLLDTHFLTGDQCNSAFEDIVADAAAKSHSSDTSYWVMPSHHAVKHADALTAESSAGVIATSTGDEADGKVANAPPTWTISRTQREDFPWIVQYLGGHSHKIVGTFAGIADIQSTDFYVAACAPHITSAIKSMPLRGSYDYLRSMRNNHMPLTSWGYSQAFNIWKSGISKGAVNAGEVTAQIASVVAAGAKGIQLFQSDVTMKQSDSDAWAAAGEMLANIAAVRDLIREGDVEGAIFSKDDDSTQSLVAVIQAPGPALVVVAINTKADGYNDLTCYTGLGMHWNFHPHGIPNIQITLPTNFGGKASVIQEATGGKLSTASIKHSVSGGQVTLSDVQLGTDVVARIFVVKP